MSLICGLHPSSAKFEFKYGEVRCADNTRPVVALLLLLLHLLPHLGVGQSKALLLVFAGASQEFFATAAISVALLRIVNQYGNTYLRTL